MNNTSSILELVNKIPAGFYFSEMPDRQQALKYVDYLYNNVPASRQVDADKLFREVISRELRGVSMKIIEPEILLLVALDKITLADFQLASSDLVRKVITQNPDKYDLDIMQRIMAQIMTKLPRDLRERVAGKHKLQIFQLIARQLNMSSQLLEKFASYDPSLNSMVSMELDASDYNTLNKKYLQELYNYQKKQPYISANSLEYGSLAAEMALAKAQEPLQPTNQSILKAQYIDESPSLMVGTEDKTLYYFDPSSGTLSEMPMNNNQTPVSVQDLKTILASQKINQADIQNAIDDLKPTIPTTTTAAMEEEKHRLTAFFSGLENAFSGLITGATQAQATIQTTAKLAPTEPVPPAFLTKLYKLKHGEDKTTSSNYSSALSDNYIKMITELGGSNISSKSGGYQNQSNLSTSQVASLPTGMYSNQTRPNYLPYSEAINDKRGYTQNEALPIFEVTNPQTTYAAFSGPAPNQTNTITSSSQSIPSTTVKSSFANLGNNSQIISPTEQKIAAKIKNDTKNVEKIAIGFITILILIFLIAVITYVKSAKSSN